MPSKFGALDIPAPAPAANKALGDPAIDVLASFFATVLTANLGAAWLSVAPGEPLVRTVSTLNPEDVDFRENSLPLLAVYRRSDDEPKRLADGYQETETLLHVLWIPPPATHVKAARRFPFFAAFDKIINLSVLNERDKAWIHEADAGAIPSDDPERARAMVAAQFYGSDIIQHAGLGGWSVRSVERVPVEVPTDQGVAVYPGYLASLIIRESNETPAGASPVMLRFTVTSGGAEPATIAAATVPSPED